MIPARFAIEYPERCLTLLEMLEPMARDRQLLGSFGLLVASAAFVIPYERMKAGHPLNQPTRDDDLVRELKRLDNRGRFLTAPFWNSAEPGTWRFARIVENVNRTNSWRDKSRRHPMAHDAENSISRRKPGEVLRVIRNALAHGNVVYLNADGFEERNTAVQFLGFISRYEESKKDQLMAETFRLVVTTEENFVRFTRSWIRWISSFAKDAAFSTAA